MAKQIGAENLSKPDIAAALAAKRAEINTKVGVTIERLRAVGDAGIRELFNENGGLRNPKELTKEQAAALETVKVTNFTPLGEDTQTYQRGCAAHGSADGAPTAGSALARLRSGHS